MAEILDDDPIYVAVGKDDEESRLTLIWVLQNLQARKICLLHVHQPTDMTPSTSGLEANEIEAIREVEWNSMYESLNEYVGVCQQEGMNTRDIDISCIAMSDVGEGIVEHIYEKNIKKLVMGAAADAHPSDDMACLRSRKSNYVSRHAPHSCQIWFVCRGHVIQTAQGQFDRAEETDTTSDSDDLTSHSSQPDMGSALIPFEAIRTASENEAMYREELRLRKETEDKLAKEKEEHERTRLERDEAVSKALDAQRLHDEESEKQKQEIERLKKGMEEALSTAMDGQRLLEIYKNERDELLEERDDAIKVTEELLKTIADDFGSDQQPPSYFICPISQEIMRDPHFAADGFTYEAEKLREWLDSGRDTSPMTNLELEHHDLVPNLALRSAIQEWLQRHPSFLSSS